MEVKTGDPELGKTRATGAAMRRRYRIPAALWSNYILLPSHQLANWEAVPNDVDGKPETCAVTWDQVAVGIRRGLVSDESRLWKAFGFALVAAVEQLLVGFPGDRIDKRPIDGASATISIAVNWYEADGDYPFYALSIEPVATYSDAMQSFAWSERVAPSPDGIRYEPNPDVLDLEEGFRLLLNEVVRFLDRHDENR